ncbi:MAG: hypothetical protein ACI9FN_002998 [Saprospiraceae bacterium]|jgi:hypothetical protein
MIIKSKYIQYISCSFILTLAFSCHNPREPLQNEFKALHEVVRSGAFDRYKDYLDVKSSEFVSEMSQAENMKPKILSEIGERYDLGLWCAAYYKYHSDHILQKPGESTFFKYLAMSETPLFEYKSDFDLIEDKTRIGDENYIAIGKQSGDYRYVNWLKYFKIGASYKLDLLYLLKLEEGRSWNVEKTNAFYLYGKNLPANWRQEAIESFYQTAKIIRLIIIEDFDKRARKGEDVVDEG